jgi:hypothetical protein
MDMKHQLLAVGITMGLCAVAGPSALHGAAQGARATSAATAWKTPKTPWGHPDLQGVWVTDEEIGVPLERPVDLGEKATLTEEEFRRRAEALKKKYLKDDKADRAGEIGNEQGPVTWYEGGKHVSNRTSLVIDPLNGRIPPYTPEAQKRVVRPGTELGFVGGSFGNGPYNGPEDLALTDRCITRGLPQTWFPSEYNNGFEIVQSANFVTLYYERLHEARVIPLDGRPHLAKLRQWLGDSRARWDGDTLVIDVSNFSDRTSFRKAETNLHLTERITRVNADTVRVAVTVEDPTTWTRPWTFAVTGKKDPSYWQIFEYACHEGNYGMRNILSGARAQEKAAAAASKKNH